MYNNQHQDEIRQKRQRSLLLDKENKSRSHDNRKHERNPVATQRAKLEEYKATTTV